MRIVLGLAAVVVVVVVVVVVGCWLLVVGCWLLVVGCWLLVVCCLLSVVCCCLSLFVVFVVCRLLFLLIYEDIHWLYTQVSSLQKTRHTSRWGFVRGYRKWPNIVCKQQVETTIPNQYVDWAWLGIYACPHQKKTNNVFSCNRQNLEWVLLTAGASSAYGMSYSFHASGPDRRILKRGKVFPVVERKKPTRWGLYLVTWWLLDSFSKRSAQFWPVELTGGAHWYHRS